MPDSDAPFARLIPSARRRMVHCNKLNFSGSFQDVNLFLLRRTKKICFGVILPVAHDAAAGNLCRPGGKNCRSSRISLAQCLAAWIRMIGTAYAY